MRAPLFFDLFHRSLFPADISTLLVRPYSERFWPWSYCASVLTSLAFKKIFAEILQTKIVLEMKTSQEIVAHGYLCRCTGVYGSNGNSKHVFWIESGSRSPRVSRPSGGAESRIRKSWSFPNSSHRYYSRSLFLHKVVRINSLLCQN